jgi:hypothetical protein
MNLRPSPARLLFLSSLLSFPAAAHLSACSANVSVVTTDIGPAGGTVLGPDGAQAVIPAGALTQTTSISIRTVPAASAPALSGGLAYTGDVYAFEPHGLSFSSPVQVRLPVPAGATTATVLHASCPAGGSGASGGSAWDAPVSGVTPQSGFAVVSAKTFSLYAAADLGTGTGGAGGSGAGGGDVIGEAGPGGCAYCTAGEVCDGTEHCVQVLASGLVGPGAIAVDAANVYWASGTDLMQCASAGCGAAPTALVSGEDAVTVIALDATQV